MNITEQNKIREEIQAKAVELSKSNDKLLLQFATGAGKSLAALKIIDQAIKDGDTRKWHIVVWETKHITNWQDDIAKHKMEHILPYVDDIYCYASLRNKASNDVNYICDEAHHMFGETYWLHLSINIKYKLVALTATMPAEKLKQLKQQFKGLQRYSITLSDAIKRGLLPRPNIYVVPVGFDNLEYSETVHITKGRKEQWEKMPEQRVRYGQHWTILKQRPSVLNLVIECTKAQKLEHLNKQVDWQKQLYFRNNEEFQKIRWMRAGGDRKNFIAEAKTNIAKRIDKELKKLKMRKVVFCGSVDQAIELGQDHTTIHSRISSKESGEIVQSFNDMKISELYTNRMIREGMNLKLIECGIIVQLDKESLNLLQMIGRVLRSNNPHIFIMVAHNTQDDKYFNSASMGIDPELFKPFTDFFDKYKKAAS